MKNCLNCGKELQPKEGKREKKFCDTSCRYNYWRKNNQVKEPKFVQFKTYKKAVEKIKELESKIDFKPTTKSSYDSEKTNNLRNDEIGQWQEPKEPNTDTQQKIAKLEVLKKEIKNEKIPPVRDTPLGRRAWNADQSKKLQDINGQINELKKCIK